MTDQSRRARARSLAAGPCCWGLSGLDPNAEFVCGEPTAAPGCPYCLEHRKRAFAKAMVALAGVTASARISS